MTMSTTRPGDLGLPPGGHDPAVALLRGALESCESDLETTTANLEAAETAVRELTPLKAELAATRNRYVEVLDLLATPNTHTEPPFDVGGVLSPPVGWMTPETARAHLDRVMGGGV